MIRSLLFPAMLMVAACSQQQSSSQPANEAVTEAATVAEEVPLLAGEWAIAAVDGRLVSTASAMTASFNDGKLSVMSGCLKRAWTYTQERNTVAFTADPSGSANCGASPSGEQETAYAALEEATIAIFNKGGAEASLSGPGGTLKLERR